MFYVTLVKLPEEMCTFYWIAITIYHSFTASETVELANATNNRFFTSLTHSF
jgi:hypothetical protein